MDKPVHEVIHGSCMLQVTDRSAIYKDGANPRHLNAGGLPQMCDIYLNLELMRADLKYIFQYYSLHSRHLVEGGHDAFCSYAAVLPAAERHFKRSEEAGAVDDCSSCFHSRSYFEGTFLIF